MKSLFKEDSEACLETSDDIEMFSYVPLKTEVQIDDEKSSIQRIQKDTEQKRQDTEKLCQKMIEDAKKEAEAIRDQSLGEAERYCREAVEHATEAFYRKAEKELIEEKIQMKEMFDENTRDVFAEMTILKEKLTHRYLNELKDIAVAVGEKIIGVALDSSSDVIEKMILREVEKENHLDYIRIYIDQMSYSALVQTNSDIMEILTDISDNIKFVVAENKPQGHCIIETPEEITDISVETQLRNVKERLKSIRM